MQSEMLKASLGLTALSLILTLSSAYAQPASTPQLDTPSSTIPEKSPDAANSAPVTDVPAMKMQDDKTKAGAGTPDADMQKVLTVLSSLNPKPIETLSATEARRQPTPTDAVMKIIKDENIKADPHAGISVSNSYFADMGNLRLRYYTPEKTTDGSNLPVVIYFRGGGWVIADLDVYDATPSALARKGNMIVVSVDYPLAPEKKFPAAHQEAIDAYKYIEKNARGWGGNPKQIVLFGESAGGNLAINTAIAARDMNMTPPVGIVSVYPVATTTENTPSKTTYADAKPLNTPMMDWFFKQVLETPDQANDPRLNLVNANLKGLPPTLVINAEIDPLASDGDLLVQKLKSDGVKVDHRIYTGVTHEFFGMDAVLPKARQAQDEAVAAIKTVVGTSAPSTPATGSGTLQDTPGKSTVPATPGADPNQPSKTIP